MKSTAALVALVSALSACATPPEGPPSAVEVKTAVPEPCRFPEPVCKAPAYNAAKKGEPGDKRLKLLRSEAVEQEDCLRLYRAWVSACRTPLQ